MSALRHSSRRIISRMMCAVLALGGFAASVPAQAAALPSEVNIRLSNVDKSSMSDKSYWWTNEAASKSWVKFVEAGGTLTLHYQVTTMAGVPVANAPLTISQTPDNVQKTTYAEFPDRTSTVTVNTDSNGMAVFIFHNTTANADAEPRPVSPSSMNYWADSRVVSSESTFNFIPSIGLDNSTKVNEHIDRVWTHTVQSSSLPVANIRLSDTDKATMTDKSYWWTNEADSHTYVKFVEAGSALSLHYKVTDGANRPIANTPITLSVTTDGTATFSGTLSSTTDANGLATFTLTSTTNSSNAEPRPLAPSSMSYWDDSWTPTPETKYQIDPTVGAATEHVDRVWTHTVKSAATALPVANIRLAAADAANMTDKSYWWQQMPAGDKVLVAMVEAGSDLVLHYRATGASGAPLANTLIALATNAGGATFTGNLTATTDSNGYATFTLHSTTDNSAAEPRPVAPSSMTYWDDSRGASLTNEVKFDFTPTVGALSEHVDRVWTHTVQKAAARPLIRLVNPAINLAADTYDATQWLQGAGDPDTRAYVKYFAAGGQMVLRYRATMSDTGAPIAGQTLTLRVNDANSSATFTAGTTAIAAGATTTLTATTDVNGYATFNLVNTNTTAQAEPVPANLNDINASWTANPKVELGGSITPTLGGTSEAVDILFAHFTKPLETPKAGTPGAPIISSVAAGNTKVTITFTAGKAGTTPTKYYGYSLDGGTTWVDNTKNTKSPIIVTGLVNGTSYSVKLRAWNTIGSGFSSAVFGTTPIADKPAAPKISSVVGGAGQATVVFTPGIDGGAAITNYEYSIDGGKTFTAMSPAVRNSPLTITGLGYAVKYTIAIRAVNSSGSGTASAGKAVTTTKIPQTITFAQPAAMKVGGADQSLTYATDSGLVVTIASTTPKVCTIVAGKLHAVGAGSCSVTASQAGTATYAAGAAITRKVTITL